MPIRKPLDDEESQMRGENWKKELTLKIVFVRNDVPYISEYDFFADKIPCRVREGGVTGPMCGNDHTWLMIRSGKVFWACARHGIVNGPLSVTTGIKFTEKPVTPEVALKTCKASGQKIPRSIADLYEQSKAKTWERRRPQE